MLNYLYDAHVATFKFKIVFIGTVIADLLLEFIVFYTFEHFY